MAGCRVGRTRGETDREDSWVVNTPIVSNVTAKRRRSKGKREGMEGQENCWGLDCLNL